MTACMGGWCARRGACAHYHAAFGEPVERLCEIGSEAYFMPRRVDAASAATPSQNGVVSAGRCAAADQDDALGSVAHAMSHQSE